MFYASYSFSELECRKVAVSGILVLLRNLKPPGPVGGFGREVDFTLSQVRINLRVMFQIEKLACLSSIVVQHMNTALNVRYF